MYMYACYCEYEYGYISIEDNSYPRTEMMMEDYDYDYLKATSHNDTPHRALETSKSFSTPLACFENRRLVGFKENGVPLSAEDNLFVVWVLGVVKALERAFILHQRA